MARKLNKRTKAEQELYDRVMGPMNRNRLLPVHYYHAHMRPLAYAARKLKRQRVCHEP